MEPISFFFIVVPLAIIISVLIGVILFLSRKNEETEYEKDMKDLRKSLIKRDIDHKKYLYMSENLKAEELISNESERLAKMVANNEIDSDTYLRMKQVLNVGFNDRLMKIHEKHNT